MDAATIITSILGGGGIGAVITTIIKTRAARRREGSSVMSEYIERLERRLERVESQLDRCRKSEQEMRKEMAGLRDEVVRLSGMLERLEYRTIAALIVADQKGKIVEWNPAATALFHWTRDEAIGQPITIVTPPRYRAKHLRAFAAAVREGRAPVAREKPLELEGIDRDGNLIPITVSLNGWTVGEALFYSAEIRRRE